jgi:hypothetical protein
LYEEAALKEQTFYQKIKEKHADELAKTEDEYKKSLETKEKSTIACNAIKEELVQLTDKLSSSLATLKSYQNNELNSAAQSLNNSHAYLMSLDRENYKSSSIATKKEKYIKILEAQGEGTKSEIQLKNELDSSTDLYDSSLAALISYQNNELHSATQAVNNSQVHLDSINRENYKSMVNEPIKHCPKIIFGIRDHPFYTDNWVARYKDKDYLEDLEQAKTNLNTNTNSYNNCKQYETQLINEKDNLQNQKDVIELNHINKLAENEILVTESRC